MYVLLCSSFLTPLGCFGFVNMKSNTASIFAIFIAALSTNVYHIFKLSCDYFKYIAEFYDLFSYLWLGR